MPTCTVEGCSTDVVGLDDGWERSRGVCCSECIDYETRHGHWPDEPREPCAECIIDDGGVRHDCAESSIDVVLAAESTCPHCGVQAAEVALDD